MQNDVLHGLCENWKIKTEENWLNFNSFKGWHLPFPESERKPQNFKVFKGLFKGRKKFKGFSRVSLFSKTGDHHAPILPTPFFKLCPTPPSLLPPTPPTLLILLSYFFSWMGDCTTFDVLFYFMISWMYTSRALGSSCLFYVTRHQVYWGLTLHVVFCWYSGLISHAHKHTYIQRHIAHSGANVLTHPYKYIFTPTVMCSQQLSLLHWMKNSLISKIYFLQCLSF